MALTYQVIVLQQKLRHQSENERCRHVQLSYSAPAIPTYIFDYDRYCDDEKRYIAQYKVDYPCKLWRDVLYIFLIHRHHRRPAWVLGKSHDELLGQSGLARFTARYRNCVVCARTSGKDNGHEAAVMARIYHVFRQHWFTRNVFALALFKRPRSGLNTPCATAPWR